MNNFEPFDTVIPTLENMSEKFILDIRDIVEAGDAKLIKMESSETPTRSYIISFEEDEDFKETIRNRRKESMDAEIDAVVDRIAQKKED
jgi:6-pyruvoyltetrahydropterin/6-carboxytetrahydropterin synthase